ncbi:chemotaxis protein CheC [Halalkaliarchaeum sp. AArc-GB]|uniref:chemotaxis protein CheC n=1 Tax=Halalkaliarchaeum sp. AArc-GB TaxID=3074078 RepID=UPI0028629D41|nr:chemotaxis protein CheC [Halalkaliarchaeum sp. AArc-GB]MDR5674434.1 chemotaxis protein CheC [Halalkaliarchaeum sp. AArc-GB]
MRIDVRALGAYSRLADRGADRAASALAELTGTDLRVEVTGASLATGADLADSFKNRQSVGVSVGLRGGIEGEAVLAFDADAAEEVTALLPGGESMGKSAISELGNIALGGFLDGWANYLETGIDMTPPRYIEAEGAAVLPHGAQADDGVFLFESRLEALSDDLGFAIYMLPESDPFRKLLNSSPTPVGPAAEASADADATAHADGQQTTSIPYESLSTFASLAKRGSENAAGNVAAMTGLDTSVEVSRLRFVALSDLPTEIGDARRAGTVFELEGDIGGYLAILFEERDAARIAGAMLPMEPGEPLGEMAQNALSELGNVMTSGFIDSWANVLETTIEHTPPNYVNDMGSAVMSPLVTRLGRRQEYGFVIDATIETAGVAATCDIYALPNERELAAALSALEGR